MDYFAFSDRQEFIAEMRPWLNIADYTNVELEAITERKDLKCYKYKCKVDNVSLLVKNYALMKDGKTW